MKKYLAGITIPIGSRPGPATIISFSCEYDKTYRNIKENIVSNNILIFCYNIFIVNTVLQT